jgi:CheY-like chemotaxis protein
MPQVLVVDDDASIRQVLRLTLEEEGYAVLEAADGLGALDMLRAAREPLVVLLDFVMPRLTGEDVLAALAADPDLAALHACIFLSANADMLSARCRRLVAALGVPVMRKPFDVDHLLRVVGEAAARLAYPAAAMGRVPVALFR